MRWRRPGRSTRCRPGARTPTITSPERRDGGARVELKGLTWRPARRRTPVLSELDLTIEAGERVVVAGSSGAGKSTLLRAMAGLLRTADHGDLSGHAMVDGRRAGQRPGGVALLLQDPSAAVVAETVGRDVAFGPENLRVPRDEIWSTVHRVMAETSFPYDVGHPTSALSGGECQRLALAGGLALGSRVLLLDEPTSMLDEHDAAPVRAAIEASVERQGTTLVVVEHHIEPWLDFVDRLVVLGPDGSLLADGAPRRVLADHGSALALSGVWVPGLGPPSIEPLPCDLIGPFEPVDGDLVCARQVGVTLTSRTAGRRRRATRALADVDATLRAGRGLAVRGPSGAGKSTLVTVLAGLLRPTEGTVEAGLLMPRGQAAPWRWSSRELASRLAWSPQLPEVGMVSSTVRDELRASGLAVGRDRRWLDRRTAGLLDAFGLGSLAERSPYQLSGGEQRRLMVGAALVHGPAAALFDEPTVGQDRLTWAAVLSALAGAREAGAATAVATHDRVAADSLADDTLILTRPGTGTTS